MRVGFIAVHADDEVHGCGGTIALLGRKHDVHIIILGEGLSSRSSKREDTPPAAVAQLQDEARQICRATGAKAVHFGGLPDNRFYELPLLDLIKIVEGWTEQLRPETVYTHHPADLNMHHALTFRAVLAATWAMQGCLVRDLYAFEAASSTEWAFQRFEPCFRPSVFVDISSTIETRVTVMQAYLSEARPFYTRDLRRHFEPLLNDGDLS